MKYDDYIGNKDNNKNTVSILFAVFVIAIAIGVAVMIQYNRGEPVPLVLTGASPVVTERYLTLRVTSVSKPVKGKWTEMVVLVKYWADRDGNPLHDEDVPAGIPEWFDQFFGDMSKMEVGDTYESGESEPRRPKNEE
jgi:hypothetical protein